MPKPEPVTIGPAVNSTAEVVAAAATIRRAGCQISFCATVNAGRKRPAPEPAVIFPHSMEFVHSGNLRRVGICLAIAIAASCGALAQAAGAKPPNDRFSHRIDLGSALPVETVGSNVGATTEDWEEPVNNYAAGHSVWWEWEAPADGWIAFDTCNSSFAAGLGVFEGQRIDRLSRVVESYASETPCPAQGQRITFWAFAGHKYEIGVDGDTYTVGPQPGMPPLPPPVLEGNVVLKIESPPPPANDDFAAAEPITANVL